jgi:autotransporter-associated beta strand protein
VLRPPRIRSLLRALLLVSLVTPRAHAVEWSGNGLDGNWSNPMNWYGSVPTSGTAFLEFSSAPPSGATTLIQDINNPFGIGTINFYDTGFTITGDPLQFNSSGFDASINLNSQNRQTFNTPLILATTTHIYDVISGGITLNGNVSGAGALDDHVATTLGASSVSLAGLQSYFAPLTLSSNITLASTASGNIGFASTVRSATTPVALTVNTGGVTTFSGAVGGTVALASLTTNAPGSTTLNGGSVTTTGAQTYGDNVNLGAATALTSTGSGNITFNGNVNGAFALTVDSAATTTFAGGVGNTTRLASISTNNAGFGLIKFTGPGAATTGTQTYVSPVEISGASVLLDSSAGNITFSNPVNGTTPGTSALQLKAPAGSIIFGSGPIGAGTPLASISAVATNFACVGIIAGSLDLQASNDVNIFGSLTSTTGSVFIAGNTINLPPINAGAGAAIYCTGTGTCGAIAGPGGFTMDGGGSLTLNASNTYTGPTNVKFGILHVSGSIQASSGVGVNTFQVFVTDTPQTVRSLVLSPASTAAVGGSALKVGDGTSASPLTINPVIIPFPPPLPQNKTVLQLQGHGLIVDYSPGNESTALSQIRSYIFQGAQTGNGILNNTGKPIGYAQASEVLGAGGGAFLGLTTDATSVLVRPTLPGDANLDGAVNFTDLVQLAQHYNTNVSATTDSWWFNGDFTYDGTVDFTDLVLLAQNYNAVLFARPIPGAPAEFEADLAAAFASVPEPSSSACALLAGHALCLARRRTRVKFKWAVRDSNP